MNTHQALQPFEGLALSLLAPVLYVLPFYCAPGMATASRDDLKTVLFRCCGVTGAAVACILLVHFYPRMPSCAVHQWLGLLVTSGSVNLPVVLLMAVYSQTFVDMVSGKRAIPYTTSPLHVVVRDLIMAPVSEEIVFRGYICWVCHNRPVECWRAVCACAPLLKL
jgi:membrane protease YdiL (CAAX protease family)